MHWIGPFKIGHMLDRCLDYRMPRPPETSGSCYLVTRDLWHERPTRKAAPLYVGGNTTGAERFRTRVGELLADAFGFYSKGSGHHSGGQSLHKWCRETGLNPTDLYIAWTVPSRSCHRCIEVRLHKALDPTLNRRVPSRCPSHSGLSAYKPVGWQAIRRAHVLNAIRECDDLGAKKFRRKYHFGEATSYLLRHRGRDYDSKAILGVAYGYANPDEGPLGPQEFRGGVGRVLPLLRRLKFEAIERTR